MFGEAIATHSAWGEIYYQNYFTAMVYMMYAPQIRWKPNLGEIANEP